MRAQVQRVSRASVTVDGAVVGRIDAGFLAYVGAQAGDTASDAAYIADKLANLRVFLDDAGKMNRSILEAGGSILLVSAFSLLADARQGRRPSFIAAAPPEEATALLLLVEQSLRGTGIRVETGQFRAHMLVESVNDGPICIPLDSRKLF
ncbi:MAG: D-aminoacyl-tRNA deacylase [Phycisphaerae bacterium]|nr:D-aminoacyl-tRNA deacylase [Phycisphaerae bacterium]